MSFEVKKAFAEQTFKCLGSPIIKAGVISEPVTIGTYGIPFRWVLEVMNRKQSRSVFIYV